MKLSHASERIDNRVVVRQYFMDAIDAREFWRVNLFEDYRVIFREHFGPRLHTHIDSDRRRLDVWYVDSWETPFWIICGSGRGTSYEVLPSATDEQCLAILKRLGDLFRNE